MDQMTPDELAEAWLDTPEGKDAITDCNMTAAVVAYVAGRGAGLREALATGPTEEEAEWSRAISAWRERIAALLQPKETP